MFVENDPVMYDGMKGIVAFIDKKYIVIQIDPAPKRNPARLIVYRDKYDDIIKLNENEV